MVCGLRGVILAAGLGTRLRPLTYIVPKPLLPLGDRTVIEHIIDWFKKYDINNIIIATSYLSRVIENYLGNGEWLGVKIEYAHGAPLGTGGQLYTLKNLIHETFIVTYGDSITNLDLKSMIKFHKEHNAAVTIAVAPINIKIKYGVIKFDAQGKFQEWEEKPDRKELVNIGVYVMEPKVFEYLDGKIKPMNELISQMAKNNEPIYVFSSNASFDDIGDYQEFIEINNKYTEKLGKI